MSSGSGGTRSASATSPHEVRRRASCVDPSGRRVTPLNDETKRALLELVDGEQRRVRRLIDSLPSPRFDEPVYDAEGGESAWTLKDILWHLAQWKRTVIQVGRQQGRPDAPLEDRHPATILGLDWIKVNDALLQATRSRSLADVIAEFRSTHEELMPLLASLPPQRLLKGPRPTNWREWLFPAIAHYQWHRVTIMDALGLSEPPTAV